MRGNRLPAPRARASKLLDFLGRKPAEGDEFEFPAIGCIRGIESAGAVVGLVGGVHIEGLALNNGFRVGGGNHVSIGIACLPAGADPEGVGAGGNGWPDDLEDVGLGEPARDAGGAVALFVLDSTAAAPFGPSSSGRASYRTRYGRTRSRST